MSQFVPNTLVAIFRDGTPPDGRDAWDNPVPAATPTADLANARDLPALITEFSKRVWQPAEGRADSVTQYRLRLRPGATPFEITSADRVLDQRSGRYYAVDEVPLPGSTAQAGDTRLVLRRVS
jgi:hypothetical protein